MKNVFLRSLSPLFVLAVASGACASASEESETGETFSAATAAFPSGQWVAAAGQDDFVPGEYFSLEVTNDAGGCRFRASRVKPSCTEFGFRCTRARARFHLTDEPFTCRTGGNGSNSKFTLMYGGLPQNDRWETYVYGPGLSANQRLALTGGHNPQAIPLPRPNLTLDPVSTPLPVSSLDGQWQITRREPGAWPGAFGVEFTNTGGECRWTQLARECFGAGFCQTVPIPGTTNQQCFHDPLRGSLTLVHHQTSFPLRDVYTVQHSGFERVELLPNGGNATRTTLARFQPL